MVSRCRPRSKGGRDSRLRLGLWEEKMEEGVGEGGGWAGGGKDWKEMGRPDGNAAGGSVAGGGTPKRGKWSVK